MDLYGLIGKKLGHSFSPGYFKEKFRENHIDADYKLFEMDGIDEVVDLVNENPNLKGFNVTIPFKREVIKYIDFLSDESKQTKSVNTIKIETISGKPVLYGHNTDIIGFEKSLLPLIKDRVGLRALVLGTGGSALSVSFVLDHLDIEHFLVSRNPSEKNQISYKTIDLKMLEKYHLIINATPVGMYPFVDNYPEIPYQDLSSRHLLFDLIYNPIETVFLSKGKQLGAGTSNGMAMLKTQADAAWDIWQLRKA